MLPNLNTNGHLLHTFFEWEWDVEYTSKSKFKHRPDLFNENSESIQFRQKALL